MKNIVVVGMSGGVDSSVSAYLLKSQGYDVIGLFMKNWEENILETSHNCSAVKDYEDVQSVCDKLKIPYYSFSFSQEYQDRVFKRFLEEYRRGLTPNPDIFCNREIKFDLLLEKANELGGKLATGHYCGIKVLNDQPVLTRGIDPNKDQSYFLSNIHKSSLNNVIFPLSSFYKHEVRKVALEQNLSTANKKDSVGICFIGKRNFKAFLSRYIPPKKGVIVNFNTNEVVGEHDGVFYYTIGQRKGLRIGGKGPAWFVVNKDISSNVLYVVQGENNPALYKKFLRAKELNWFLNIKFPLKCTAKIRYRSEDTPCLVLEEKDGVKVIFETPQKAITPSQAIVFYKNEICLGGGIIQDFNYLEPEAHYF